MSSSNRVGGVCDAVVQHHQQSVGPLRLPPARSDDFIAHFNRVYASLGLKLTSAPPALPLSDQSPSLEPPHQSPNPSDSAPGSES